MNVLALTNTSQLIIRNSRWLESSQLLMIGVPADGLASQLLDQGITDRIAGLTRDFSDYRKIRDIWSRNDKLSLAYAPVFPVSRDSDQSHFDGILLFLQKSKPLMDFWLQMALTRLSDGGSVWMVGENSEGIKSWKKRLKQHFARVKTVDNARHSVLLEASEPLPTSTQFSMSDHFQTFHVDQSGTQLAMCSLPGVFSHGRLDVGTKVLFDTLTDLPEGRVLDFGCGAGVISAYIDQLPGERAITLVDSDALAVESSRRTLSMAKTGDFEVVASDGLSEVKGMFDLIISNPPFHRGVKTSYAVTEQFLKQSLQHLRKGGELRIVANSFLRYPPIIKETFGNCETLIVNEGFSVYRAFK